MKRLGFALVGLILLLVPGDALASLTLTSPADSTSLHANQTLTVSWTPDGDATANDAAPSYLLFTGTYWTTRITLNQAGIRAHSFSFRPNETVASLLANHGPNVLAAAVTPPIGSDYVLPGGVYAIDLFILDGTGGVHDRASAVGLNVVDQCGVGTYSLDGWPPCTQATPGHYVFTGGSTNQLPCAPGTFVGIFGNYTCDLAPPGGYVPIAAATAPTDCSAGTYQDEPGQIACKTAPAGSFVATTGATAAIPCPAGASSPPGSTAASACVTPPTVARTDTASATPAAPSCVIAGGKSVTAACVARQLGISIAKPTTSRLALPSGKQAACVVRRKRIIGSATGSCRVLLVVAKPGSMPKTYRATVIISA